MNDQVAIIGVGHSAVGRRLERPLGLLAVDAAMAAITDAGLTVDDIDGAATYPRLPQTGSTPRVDGMTHVSVDWMVRHLGARSVRWWAQPEYGNVSTAIESAVRALADGRCDYAVVWRALHLPKAGSYQTSHNRQEARGELAFTAPYGYSGAAGMFAMAYTRYQQLYGATREHMAALVLAQRRGALLNPHAHFKDTPLTLDEYMAARTIAEPLCLFDCDIPVDGAGAIVLARADRAADAPNPGAWVTGLGQSGIGQPGTFALGAAPSADLYERCRMTARTIGDSLWETSGLKPEDIGGAMLYDGFAPDVYIWLEELGFCKEGEAFEFIQGGRVEIHGELPINTFGGSLSEGRLHGIGHWIEATLQVQGRAGARQISNAENVVVATGLLNHGSGAVLSRSSRP
ncbi:thiolase C-terminal domain-containing protein [Rhodococcus rhodochrous]|uniref:thiolase C-terminal domain-containing protein n=1 Tax=Rhodococcus rhodochrous TaxID=1829 RepID=UPI0003152231|nr:hypothetical protein [Rhodococcus rhodochrous]